MSGGAGIFAVGTGLNILGKVKGARSATRAARENANIAEINAENALESARIEERRISINRNKDIGAIRAGFIGGGVAESGSALDVLTEASAFAEQEAALAKIEGFAKAGFFKAQARQSRDEAQAFKNQSFFDIVDTALTAPFQFQSLFKTAKPADILNPQTKIKGTSVGKTDLFVPGVVFA